MNQYNTLQEHVTFFDDNFLRSIWGKRPAEIKLISPFKICDEGFLIEALSRYSSMPESLRKNNSLTEFVTAVNNIKTDISIQSFAANVGDLTLDGYLDRVDALNPNRDWSIAYFGLHGASTIIWDNAKRFVTEISNAIGFRPGGRVDVDCFIGRYASTPSGIHVDNAHNFAFTIRNGKTMYTWNSSEKKLLWLKSPNYDKFKIDAKPLDNNIDCICYFPHDTLHVAETKKSVSVNINVSLWHSANETQQNIDYLVSRLKNEAASKNPIVFSGETKISEIDKQNIEILNNSLKDGSFEKQVALNQLLTCTTNGMKVPRPRFDNSLIDIPVYFKLRLYSTVNWYRLQSFQNEFLIAANGHCVSCKYSSEIENFLNLLINNKNNFICIDDFTKSTKNKIENLILFLYESGAIEKKI